MVHCAIGVLALLSWASLPASAVRCFERSVSHYALDWASQGRTFFDGWDFGERDFTYGAVRYVNRSQAEHEGLTQAHEHYAIVQPGGIEKGVHLPLQRKSVRLSSHQSWRYFLAAMRFERTPWGCGVWPAWWTNGASGNWPTDGELDILEYWQSDAPSEVSFHTGDSAEDGCTLNRSLLNKPGCPSFPDINNKLLPWLRYDCRTDYNAIPPHLGCAPSSSEHPRPTGRQYANSPGVIAAEWTREFIKVFYFNSSSIPADLEHGSPQPDLWDEHIVSYYPFGASGCNLSSRSLSSPQSMVLNIELCGGRGSLEFPWGCNGISTCRNKNYAGPGDCCTEYMTDAKKSSKAIKEQAFFNISWIKVWQHKEEEF